MTLQLKRHKITVDEYYKMAEVGILKADDRVELIHGEIITMSPINNPHLGAVNILTRIIFQKVGNTTTLSIQNPIRIDESNSPEPDFVIAKFRQDGYSKKGIHPEDTFLLIEVSDSTVQYDQKVKLPIYANAKIPEYWIVNLKKQQIEQYTQPEGDKYLSKRVIKKSETIICLNIDFSIELAELFL